MSVARCSGAVSNTSCLQHRERRMSRYYSLTIPYAQWQKPTVLLDTMLYMKGQAEVGESGYEHWQVMVVTKRKCRAGAVKRQFPRQTHVELSRSSALNEYVWKDDTLIHPSTRFELGRLPLNRNNDKDWEDIWRNAKRGALELIPADVRVRSYKTIRQIEKDHMAPSAMEREVKVYWGPSSMGKSRRAWYEAGMTAYPKSPTSIYWDGYQNHDKVVIDEYRGGINVSHLLRWFDRYPVCVECKFGACILNARVIWITSNLHPREWYPELDAITMNALLRRLDVLEFNEEWQPPLTPPPPYVDTVDLTQETIVIDSDNE